MRPIRFRLSILLIGVFATTSLARAGEVSAWRTLNFGDSEKAVIEKLTADRISGQTPIEGQPFVLDAVAWGGINADLINAFFKSDAKYEPADEQARKVFSAYLQDQLGLEDISAGNDTMEVYCLTFNKGDKDGLALARIDYSNVDSGALVTGPLFSSQGVSWAANRAGL